MSKLYKLKILKCYKCPHYYAQEGGMEPLCAATGTTITEEYMFGYRGFPGFCPLEDIGEIVGDE